MKFFFARFCKFRIQILRFWFKIAESALILHKIAESIHPKLPLVL
ncbi:hypothetical protein [Helicobacter sp. 23-1045]